MALIPDHIIDQVRDAHDIVEIVGRTVPLKKAGSAWKGLCPFHDEKTPSFSVNPTRQSFKCFGCGKGGDVFTFLRETQGLHFVEAVRQLAEERAIPIPDAAPADPEQGARVSGARRALAFAHRFFVETLASEEGREARAYLNRRGYDDAAIQRFGLGYAPAGWDRLLGAAAKAGIPAPLLDEAGLVIAKREGGESGFYDRFRHRVIFPVADHRGRLATFAGRTLDPDESAKYLNGPETTVFKKAGVLYGLHRAREAIRRAGEALLMEGYTDVLMCHLHGFENAVAGMGTAFTDQQAARFSRLVDRVVLLYDGDAAGQRAAERALDVLLARGLEVRVALLPSDRDVDEILLEDGPERLTEILGCARELFDFKLDMLGERHDLSTPRGRAKASEDMLALIARVRSALERDQLLRLTAERLGGGPETESVLRAELSRILSEADAAARRRAQAKSGARSAGEPRRAAQPATDAPRGDEPRAPVPRALSVEERIRQECKARDETTLLAGALFLPDLRDSVFRAVGPEEFGASDRGRLYRALLDLWSQGGIIEFGRVMSQFGSDAAVAALLAGLPDDEGLADRVQTCVEFTERRRFEAQRLEEKDRQWRQGTLRSETLDPDASYYGDGPEETFSARAEIGDRSPLGEDTALDDGAVYGAEAF